MSHPLPAQVWGLVRCYETHSAYAASGEDGGGLEPYRICQFITDGAPTDEDFDWTTTDWPDWWIQGGPNGAPATPCDMANTADPGKIKAFCEAHAVPACTLLGLAEWMQAVAGFKLHMIVVEPDDSYDVGIFYQMSSCETTYAAADFWIGTGYVSDGTIEAHSYMWYKRDQDETYESICDDEAHWPGFACDAGCPYVTEVDSYQAIIDDAAAIVDSIEATLVSETSTTSSTTSVTTAETSAETTAVSETVQSTEVRTETVTTAQTSAVTTSEVSTGVATAAVLDSLTTMSQDTFCTGSGVSFTFLLLAAPLLAYLFLKPIQNALTNLCCPPEPGPVEPRESVLEMETNPTFGMERSANDPAPGAAPGKKARGKIDMGLTRKDKKRKKKKFGLGPGGDGDAEQAKRATFTEGDVYGRRATRRSSAAAVTMLGNASETQFSNPILAVYNGDQWQEDIADFVIGPLCCRPCRGSGAAAPPEADAASGGVV